MKPTIAIVEDELHWLNVIKEKILSKLNNVQIVEYLELSKLLESKASIYFLDIELNEKNGIELAKEIKKQNEEAVIVYVTNHENYVFDSMRTEPFGFVRKSKLDEDMEYYLGKLDELLIKSKKTIVLKRDKDLEEIQIEDIQYIEKYQGVCYFYSKNGVYTKRISLRSILEILPESNFVVIHKSVVVNLKYVVAIRNSCVVLKEGKVLQIARREEKEVKKKFCSFLSGTVL